MVRTEVILTQLVYKHSTRVRLNTASSNGKTSQPLPAEEHGEPASASQEISHQAGSINNLLTADLQNITSAMEFQVRE